MGKIQRTLDEVPSTLINGDAGDRIVKHPMRIAENVLVGNELRREQVDDLMRTIEEGEVVDKPKIEEVKTRNDNKMETLLMYQFLLETFMLLVVKDIDPYLDVGMGEVVVGEPFCKVSCVEIKRFDGIITIHDEDDSSTYQMVRSNPRFKHLNNEQCNKIPPLLKVREQDNMNGIFHSYQKLKGFYREVLNLEPDFVRDLKMEKWLTRGHISVHKTE
uniref:Homeodomain-like protein n=1 Tax=Tanacetum cinerariifolium TaxID=118510 RepID=A0A6L2K1U8_TANCI|nr:homeodomain-like protein [Tanacetum cinerariifolium]